MGVDITKLEEFLEKASFKGDSPWLRPRPNPNGSPREYRFRLLSAGDQPFFKTKQHYIVAGKERINGACPKAASDIDCPACEMFFKLIPVIDRDNEKAFWRAARKLAPTDRYYANFVDRELGTVKIWSMSHNVFTNLSNTLKTYLQAGVDITDPEKGRDFTIHVKKKGAVQEYGNIILHPSDTPVDVDDWESELHDLEALAHSRILEPDDIKTAIPDALGEFYEEALKRLSVDDEVPF